MKFLSVLAVALVPVAFASPPPEYYYAAPYTSPAGTGCPSANLIAGSVINGDYTVSRNSPCTAVQGAQSFIIQLPAASCNVYFYNEGDHSCPEYDFVAEWEYSTTPKYPACIAAPAVTFNAYRIEC